MSAEKVESSPTQPSLSSLSTAKAPVEIFGWTVRKLVRNMLVEFIGSMLYVLFGMNFASYRRLAITVTNSWYSLQTARCALATVIVGPTLQRLSMTGVMGAALTQGLLIAALFMKMGHISGGHFNPAVTMGVLVSGHIHSAHGLFYAVAQLFGGLIGSLFVRAVLHEQGYHQVRGGVVTPPASYFSCSNFDLNSSDLQQPCEIEELGILQGILLETILTFLVVEAYLLTVTDRDHSLSPLGIGFSIFASVMTGHNITGASINPARTFGTGVVASIFKVDNAHEKAYIYYIGQILGTLFAAAIYKLFLAKEEKRILLSDTNLVAHF